MVLLPCSKCCGGVSLPCQPAYTGSPGACVPSGFEGKFYKNLKVELLSERPWEIKPYALQKCEDEDLLQSWYQPEYSEYYLPFDPDNFGFYSEVLQTQSPIGPMGDKIDIVRGLANLKCLPDPSFLLFSLSIKDMRYEVGAGTPCHAPGTDWTNEFCDNCFNDIAAADYWERRVRFDPATVEEQPALLQRILEGERVLLPAEGEALNTVYCTGGSSSSGCPPAINSQTVGYFTGYVAVSMSCGPCWSCYRYNNNTEAYTVNNNVFGPPDTATRIDDRCYETKEDAEEGCDGDYCCYVRNNGETEDDYQCVSKSDPAPPSGWKNTYRCTNDPDECVENCKPCWNLWRGEHVACRLQEEKSWFESPLVEYLRYEPESGFEGDVILEDGTEGITQGTQIQIEPIDIDSCAYFGEYESEIQESCGNPFVSSYKKTSVLMTLDSVQSFESDTVSGQKKFYEFKSSGVQVYQSTSGRCLSSFGNDVITIQRNPGDPPPTSIEYGFEIKDESNKAVGKAFYRFTFRPGFSTYIYQCLTKEQLDPNLGVPDEFKTWEIVSECNATQDDCEAAIPTTTKSRTMPTNTTTTGPGTELAGLLKMIGISPKEKGCSCKSHAKRMNREGPQWCRENIETILDWLQTESKKRKLPFVKTVAKQVVLLAIRRAEKKS